MPSYPSRSPRPPATCTQTGRPVTASIDGSRRKGVRTKAECKFPQLVSTRNGSFEESAGRLPCHHPSCLRSKSWTGKGRGQQSRAVMCPLRTRLHNPCTIVRVRLCCFHRSRAIFQTQVSPGVRYNILFYAQQQTLQQCGLRGWEVDPHNTTPGATSISAN